ncbi:Fic family protein [Phenylobacterium sp.]|uniref:Fic family protein n=1 Tax=Phenylobacterium sp. TaxID=1871053 RepID=UPI0025DADFB2|nr:Fic family protein [Phenylobacterium sp.]
MSDYIYELDAWPEFRWNVEHVSERLVSVSRHQGLLIGRMRALGFQLREEAVLANLTEEVIKSSEIEGENLDRDQVRSSIARRLGMDIGGLAAADRSVEGIVEMMLDATQNYDAPLTTERLFAWHAALFPTGHSGMHRIVVAGWRTTDSGPMQVVSGPINRGRVHFEAPEAGRLPAEMSAFLKALNASKAMDPVLEAAVAHLWFVTVHPFEDGNGRIARAIADMALARSEESPQRFYSMSSQIRAEREAYYKALETTQKGGLDITDWLLWFLDCLDRAFNGAEAILAAVIRKARFWDSIAMEPISARQALVLNRLLEGFEGNLTSSKWAVLTRTSPDTALRDIEDLTRRGVLMKDRKGGRSTSYSLPTPAAHALGAVARYVRQHAEIAVTDGARLLTPEEKARRTQAIRSTADEIERLAEAAQARSVVYSEFEKLLRRLMSYGSHPTNPLVSAVAEAIHNGARKSSANNALGRATRGQDREA